MLLKKILAAGAIAAGITGLLSGGSVFAESRPYTSGEWLNYDGDEYTYRAICISQDVDYDGAPITVEMKSDENTSVQFSTDDLSADNEDYSRCVFEPLSYAEDFSDYRARFILPMGFSDVQIKDVLVEEWDDGEGNIYRGIATWLILDSATATNKYLRSYGQTTTRTDRLTSGSIVFDANGGDGAMSPVLDIDVGRGIYLPNNTFTRDDGYLFTGWNTEADGSGTAYSDGSRVVLYDYVPLVLYAQWARAVTVSFDANGGEGSMLPLEGIIQGATIDLPGNMLTKSGYGFTGWNTQADGSGAAYADEARIVVGDDILLYAQWTRAADISFDANGGEGSMSSIEGIVPGSSVVLPTVSMVREGYIFTGWNTERSGSGVAYPGGATIVLAEPVSLVLYAQWLESKAILDTGNTVNQRMIYLAGANTSREKKIRAIKTADSLPSYVTDIPRYRISSYSSPMPILAWFDTDTIYIYSDADTIYGNADMSGLLNFMESITDISALADWNMSNTTNMASMFSTRNGYSSALYDISPIADWDVSNVTKMNLMFEKTMITNLDALENWDVSNVEDMDSMFEECGSLSNISALATWDTSSVTDMHGMFYGTAITDLDALETKQHDGKGYVSWDVSNVTNMGDMFRTARSLANIDGLAKWNTSSVQSMGGMFYRTAITDLDALETKQHDGNDYVSWDVSSVTSMSMMFGGDSSYSDPSLVTDISALASWDVSSVTDIGAMFADASSLTDISALANWDTSNVTNMSAVFSGDRSLSDISALASWNTTNVTTMRYMFKSTGIINTNALETKRHEGKDYTSWDTSNVTTLKGLFSGASSLANISGFLTWNTSNVTDMSNMFTSTTLASVSGLPTLDTSNVTDMSNMFSYNSHRVDTDDLIGLDTSSVMTMEGMFMGARGLTDISALASWNISNVTNMHNMFNNTDSLADLSGISGWDVSGVIDMGGMFYLAISLTDVSDLSGWIPSSVTNMEGMFYGAKVLADVSALASWDVSSVTNMSYMFYCAVALTDVSALASWDVSSVTNMKYMFRDDTALVNISGLEGWSVSSGTNVVGMFIQVPARPLPSWYN